ncbi:hypothetical protein PHET_04288 [Paragonimus heterotremus]|uniref:Uncharacterized protein n=1 Tax=Paragonimus heterotremus TaxID=100268 RepID=A0A8J4T048_9TREM|nr:hypothetical protein PHET_04288 [Paragonimus heterotremus]
MTTVSTNMFLVLRSDEAEQSYELIPPTNRSVCVKISRECFERLAKLESENKELRKQYQNLEAQVRQLCSFECGF